MENFIKYIRETNLLSEQGIQILTELATVKPIIRKEVILHENQVCENVYFIESGLCRSVYNKDGKEINTAFHFENSFVSNIQSLKFSVPSVYRIQALEKTTLICLNKNKLFIAYKQLHEIESFGRHILEQIAMNQEEQSNTFKLYSPHERFEKLMQSNPGFFIRVSLTQAASYLGMSRETLSRLRARK